jgi:Co/Zn/Cd efflux system component
MACAHDHISDEELDRNVFRKVLWIVFLINALMFVVEFGSAFFANSVSLQADALDFLADAATYGITLMVLGSSVRIRSSAALLKGLSMGILGVWIFARTIYNASENIIPLADVMGSIGFAALIANVVCAILLYKHRSGDSNMRSVWLCITIMIAASGVFAMNSGWPDFVVASLMATLAIISSYQIIKQAVRELNAYNTV